MSKQKTIKEQMVVVNLWSKDPEKPSSPQLRGRIRVDAKSLARIGGRNSKCEAYEILSESEMIRNGLTRSSQIEIH
jgi:hypothetical protein